MMVAQGRSHKGAAAMALGRRIKSRRALKAWTQADLAAHADVSEQTVKFVEQARVRPMADTLAKLAAALGVTMDWLVNGDESQEQAAA